MQSRLIASLLVVSIFLNGFLLARQVDRPVAQAPAESAERALLLKLQLNVQQQEYLHALLEFSEVRDQRRQSQLALIEEALRTAILAEPRDYAAVRQLLEDTAAADAQYRYRATERVLIFIDTLSPAQRAQLAAANSASFFELLGVAW